MDVSRAVLDNLMGRDRNKLLDNVTERDHYSNPDVCKSFLVCFCFNTLFPNTTYDEGPCQKRHDTYLKNMFDNDPNRAQYQRQYIRECIHWIQRRLQEVQKKTKQNQSVIDNKSNFPADRPKQILDRILAIQSDIQKLIKDSQKYGQQGKIDDSLRCLEEVEKLRQRRKQIELMGSDMSNAQKQQKICVICGAIQTINDTQKRIQTHLEGKIHQGFLKLRHEVQALKIRLEVLNKMNPPERRQRQRQDQRKRQKQENQKKRQREENQRKKQRQRQELERKRQRQEQEKKRQVNDRKRLEKTQQSDKKGQKSKESSYRNTQMRQQRQHRDRSDSANGRRNKQRSKQRERSKERRQRHQQRERKQRERTRDNRQKDRRSRSKDRKEKKHNRDSRDRENKQKSNKQHKQSKEHKKKHKKNRSRSKQRDYPQER